MTRKFDEKKHAAATEYSRFREHCDTLSKAVDLSKAVGRIEVGKTELLAKFPAR